MRTHTHKHTLYTIYIFLSFFLLRCANFIEWQWQLFLLSNYKIIYSWNMDNVVPYNVKVQNKEKNSVRISSFTKKLTFNRNFYSMLVLPEIKMQKKNWNLFNYNNIRWLNATLNYSKKRRIIGVPINTWAPSCSNICHDVKVNYLKPCSEMNVHKKCTNWADTIK